MKGPKPTPTRLKVLRGNPGQRPLPGREPQVPAVVPDPPTWLEGEALTKWHEVSTNMAGLGILTRLDRDVLTVYCETWGRRRLSRFVAVLNWLAPRQGGGWNEGLIERWIRDTQAHGVDPEES